jgi:preprotein translocase SecE subunit
LKPLVRRRKSKTTLDNAATKVHRKKPQSKATKLLLKLLRPVINPLKWIFKKLVPKYFVNSFNELRNVTWPNRKESRRLTTAVIIFAVVLSLLVTLVDLGLDKVFKKVILKQ